MDVDDDIVVIEGVQERNDDASAEASSNAPARVRKSTRVKKPVVHHAKHDSVVYEDITLLPSQVEHYERLKAMLQIRPFALDFSVMGAGKTYTSSKLAMDPFFGFAHVLVICPVSVQVKWNHMKNVHGLPIRLMMSYQSLRSQKCKQPSHGLLHRRDYQVQQVSRYAAGQSETIDKVEFKASESLKTMIDEGLLLIIDEIQNIKNVSCQFLAVQALLKPILDISDTQFATSKSRVLLLSGSPIDRVEHSAHMFRSLHIQKREKLAEFNFQTYQMNWHGLQDIVEYCQRLDPNAYARIPQPSRRSTSDTGLISYVYTLFQQVFKKNCASSMLPPPMKVRLEKRNSFYGLPDAESIDIVSRGIQLLKSAVSFHDGHVNFGTNGAQTFSGITRAMQVIETGKIRLFAKIALEALHSHPQCKVVIAVNYIDTIKDIQQLLQDQGHTSLIMEGSLNESQRSSILFQFQRADPEHRVLIGNQSILSVGIDLDDKDGNFPRVCFVSPNYSTITAYQLGHRFQRADTRSDATVHFVYGKKSSSLAWTAPINQDTIELRVLNALASKSQVMKTTTPEQSGAGIQFPCDHQVFDVLD